MSELADLISDLSPEQRELFLLQLHTLHQEQSQVSQHTMIISPKGDRHQLPLSFAQQRMWFIEQMNPDTPTYNIPTAIRIAGPLDVATMVWSINAVIERHETLRTTFRMVDASPEQVIAAALKLELPLIDLRGLPEVERVGSAHTLALEEAQRLFHLERGPLARAILLRLGDEEHVVVFTLHHIISDGWSMGILIRDVAAFYEAFSTRKPPALPQLPIQYADFGAWQRAWLQGEVLEQQLGYWQQQLGGERPLLELPSDHPRPVVQSFRGATYTFKLPRRLTKALEQLSREADATLFMTMLAAFQVLLYHYTGQEDILVGTPIANRSHFEIEELIGFFANTLVLRTDLSGNPSFRELLQRVRQVAYDAYAHQDVPFEKVVEAVQPERDLSHARLFQVVFALQNVPWESTQLPGLTFTPVEVHTGTAKFDLMLQIFDGAEGLRGVVEYNTDLFEVDTIARLARHFLTVLGQIVESQDQHLADLSIIASDERQRLLVEWNATATAPLEDRCIPQLFEAQVERGADMAALVFAGHMLTYRYLNQRANQLAHHLRALGVGADVRVGICMERSIEMLIGILGILKAGGVYIPLDPFYPSERLAFMVADSLATVLLTQTQLAEQLSAHTARVVCLDRLLSRADTSHLAKMETSNLPSTVAPDNLVYIIYTSGSTGKPKGVALNHRPLANLISWQMGHAAYRKQAKSLQFASLSFDVSFQEIFSTWCSGGTLVLTTEETRQNSEALLRLIVRESVERLFLPFVALQHLAEVAGEQQVVPRRLREIITAGEQLQITPPIAAMLRSIGDCVLHNQYGPSESHVVTAFTLSGPPEQWSMLPPIGRPIAHTQIYLLNAHLRPVPIGVAGELYIGGVSLARGYLDRPDLTAERFIPNPFGTMNNERRTMKGAKDDSSVLACPEPRRGVPRSSFGERLYKTGDLARYRPDGNIEFLGRIDHQVKIRGFRIELGEIETVLAQHPAVHEAVVVAHADRRGIKRLVAYVVPNQEPRTKNQEPGGVAQDGSRFLVLGSGELRGFLQERLPDYMVPATFMMLDDLPLTPSGKIDRRALPVPEGGRGGYDERYVAPRTPIEAALASIWADVLGIERIGVHDNFFGLGGHSLLATQVISRMRNLFQIDLPLRDLFEAPTIASLATRRMSLTRQAEPGMSVPPIIPTTRERRLVLSFGQQRLWFLNRLEPDSPVYNIPGAIRVLGRLNVAALEQSLGEILRRHESLRTTFTTLEGQPVQVIAPAAVAGTRLALPVVDLRGLPEPERPALSRRLIAQEAQRPFDLEQGPLLRVTLIQSGDEEHLLLFTMHHIISDGWSIGVFIQELIVLYEAFAAQRPSPLPDLPIQYVDFALWQRQWLQGEALKAQLDYWQQQLRSCSGVLHLPTDRPRLAVQTFRGAIETRTLPLSLGDALRELSRREGVTLFMTLLAAFQTLLHRYTGQHDIVVGSPIANRNRTEIERLIGFFVNTLALRVDLSSDPSFLGLLHQVREVALGGYAHQDLPFEQLVEELQPERSLTRTPLFQVMFDLQNAPMPPLELPGLTLEALEVEFGTAKFDLALFMQDTPHQLTATFEYNTALFDAATIMGMLGHLQTLLEGIVAHPQQQLSALPLLDEGEQARLLVAWNDTLAHPTPPPDASIPQLFERQALRTPHDVAVICDDRSLTYRELDMRAGQLANYLRGLGVGPEIFVGICIERSLDMIVGMLGILKAGGAYVPMDPAYPPDRLAYMLRDAQVSVLLTQRPLLDRLPAHGMIVICLDSDWDVLSQAPAATDVAIAGDSPAYAIYTSGSTGEPKAVVGLHRATLNRFSWMWATYPFAPLEMCCQKTSFSFVDSVWESFGPLLQGVPTVLIPDAAVKDPEQFLATLARHQVTRIILVPSLLNILLEIAGDLQQRLPQLKLWSVSGEALAVDLVRRFQEKLPDRLLLNLYGSSEVAADVTWYEVAREESGSSIPIGRPIANTSVYLLDRHQRLVPIGVPGELYVGGIGLARGYLNRPDLTAERFVPDPFGWAPGMRLYRTGDLAQYARDGKIRFLGRSDQQVKIRGFRIELGEIEAVLHQHPIVRAGAVLACADRPGEAYLAAYVVLNQEPRADREAAATELSSSTEYSAERASALRSFLMEHLPDYMAPAAFVFLEALPLTPNGKIDRRALPDPAGSRPARETMIVPPRTPTEIELAQLWSELLRVERISIHDNFFDSGGHSLIAMQMIWQIQSRFGVSLPLRECFLHPTIKELAEMVEKAILDSSSSEQFEAFLAALEQLDEDEVQDMLTS